MDGNRKQQGGVPPPPTLNGGAATAFRPRSTNPARTRAVPQAGESRCRSQGRSKGAGRPRGPPSPQLIHPTCQPGACHDRARYHLRRLLAAPERTRQHPGAAGRGPPTGGGLGSSRLRQESNRPTGRGAGRPRVCRCPRPTVGPGRSARHPVARRRRPHALGAACFPAALGRGRQLADQPGGTALGSADGPGGPVPARARPQMRRVRTPRRRRADRLRQPRGRPRRCPPHAVAARLALRPSGDPGRCDGLVRLGCGEWNRSGGTFFRVDAARVAACLQPPIDGESFSMSEDMGDGLEHRAPPARPRSGRRARALPGHRRRGRGGRVLGLPARSGTNCPIPAPSSTIQRAPWSPTTPVR